MKYLKQFFHMYVDGFRNQSRSSRKLWLIIIIKLVIMFGILKVFFFKDFLHENFTTDEERIEHISNELTKHKQ